MSTILRALARLFRRPRPAPVAPWTHLDSGNVTQSEDARSVIEARLAELTERAEKAEYERNGSHKAHVYMESALVDVLSGGLLQTHENALDPAQYDLVGRVRDMIIEHEDAITELKAERDALRRVVEQKDTALTLYANSVNWMTHTDQDDDNLRRVWVGSGDGREYARAALDAALSSPPSPGVEA